MIFSEKIILSIDYILDLTIKFYVPYYSKIFIDDEKIKKQFDYDASDKYNKRQ